MNPVAIICVEGVLVDGTDLRASPPTKFGRLYYDALKTQYQLLLISSLEPNAQLVRAWLKREHFAGFGTVFTRPSDTLLSPDDWKVSKIREMQSEGWPVALYVDTDPASVRAAFLEGIPTSLLSSPRYGRPEWRPGEDRGIKPWDALVDTIEAEQLLKAPEV